MFKNSTINLDGDHSGGTITAASTDKRSANGIVFLNSTITANSVKGNPVIDPFNAANASGPAANTMYLGRPWGWQQVGGDADTVFINTTMPSAIRNVGWLAWNSNETNAANGKNNGNPAEDSRYAEFNSVQSDGVTPVDVSQRVTWSHQLTASQAAAYTVANLFSIERNTRGTGSVTRPEIRTIPAPVRRTRTIRTIVGQPSGAIGIRITTRQMPRCRKLFRRREIRPLTQIRIGRWPDRGMPMVNWQRSCRSQHRCVCSPSAEYRCCSWAADEGRDRVNIRPAIGNPAS